MKKQTYLDYNATAPLRADIRALMMDVMERPLNASAVHGFGREGRRLVEQARSQVAALVGVPPAQIIFNSGATEGNNTVLRYFAQRFPGERLLVSAIEHPSVLQAGVPVETVPVTSEGLIDLQALEDTLKTGPKTALLSLMMVNNETGVIQPVAEAAALAKKYGALVHCDAVQAAGRTPIDLNTIGIDFLTLSAHKLGGPQGAGALALGLCGLTPVLIEGGGQEKKARAGTENIAALAGFGLAAEMAAREIHTYQDRVGSLRETLESGLRTACPDIVIFGEDAPRVANTTLIGVPGIGSDSLLMNFDLEGVALSNGSACTSGSVQPSHVLAAMGADTSGTGTLRFSIGWDTQETDIDRALAAWNKIIGRVRK